MAKSVGRPVGHRIKVTPKHLSQLKRMEAEGASKAAMARATGLSRPTIYRLLQSLEDSSESKTLLRYPGGKARGRGIIPAITAVMGETYAEPFFGGGSICLALIKRNSVCSAVINDADPRVAAFWTAVIQDSEALAEKVERFEPSVQAFIQAKNRQSNGGTDAFDFLVVNRLSHGGRGILAGPQGGFEQSGKYGIGDRWNAQSLIVILTETSRMLSSVTDRCECRDFTEIPGGTVYLDPPYYDAGPELYPMAFKRQDHERLREHLRGRSRWVLSYDDHQWIREAYADCKIKRTHTNGNGGAKRELIIQPVESKQTNTSGA